MKRINWSDLLPQALTFLFLPLVAVLLVVSFGGQYLHTMEMRDLAGERDERTAQAAAALINASASFRLQTLDTLAQLPDVPPQLLARQGFDGLARLTPQALQPLSGEAHWDALPDGDRQRLFEWAAAGGPRVHLLSSAAAGQEPLLIFLSEPLSGTQRLVAVLHAAALIEPALHASLSGSQQANAFVVDGQGQPVYQLGRSADGVDLSRHAGVSEALHGQPGAGFQSETDPQHVMAYAPVGAPVGLDWALVIEEPWDTVASMSLRATQSAPLVLAPVLLIALTALWYGSRYVVEPLQKLEEQAAGLSWGNYRAIEKPVGGIAEIRRLQQELVHMAQKVEASQRGLRDYIGAMTQGQEDERRRLARELHDDTLQALIALNQRVQMAELSQQDSPSPDPATRAALQELSGLVDASIQNLRRVTRALRPIYLEDLGLAAALDVLASEARKQSGVDVQAVTGGDLPRLNSTVELALYRIAQEALNNALQHANSQHVILRLQHENGGITLEIHDDGQGFPVPESPAAFAPSGHFGLLGMHERAEMIGGTLTLESSAETGTRLRVDLRQ